MRRLLNWFKSFKGGFRPTIEIGFFNHNLDLRFFGILQIIFGYYSGEDHFLKIDGCDNVDLTAVSFNIWRFGGEIILNKIQD